MKPAQIKIRLVLACLLVSGGFAAAQTSGVPGPTDYAGFSRFIAERNIFDPNRTAHSSTRSSNFHRTASRSAPAFTLVGTMNYQKGMFAFFEGNDPELRRVLYQSDTNNIAGYTVTDITLSGVTLESADKKQTVRMKIGQRMRQEAKAWQLAGADELTTDAAASAAPVAGGPTPESAAGAAAAPNDILKRLMEQRAKELK